MNKIYIGYDKREDLAYQVCDFSLHKRANNIETVPLKLDNLPFLTRKLEIKNGKLWCPISQANCATEFAISRFSIPFLEKDGWVLFMDCDMISQADINELFDLKDDKYAVMVVKHKQETGNTVKMDGQVQSYYNRKNWSSVILWNCSHPSNKNLTLEMLNSLPGRDLHAFCWLKDEEIGELPNEWNHLIGVNTPRIGSKILHYTLGGPWIKDWKITPVDETWLDELNQMNNGIYK